MILLGWFYVSLLDSAKYSSIKERQSKNDKRDALRKGTGFKYCT